MPITFRKVAHTYNADSPFSYAALKGIDLEIPEGRVTAIIGETGSGKSTLVQHLNALLLPTEGEVQILDKTITADTGRTGGLRQADQRKGKTKKPEGTEKKCRPGLPVSGISAV